MHLSFRSTRQPSDDDPENETDHSATFLSAFYVHTMRTSLSRFKLCLLCCALAQGVGLTCAVQSASLRPPDAVSAVDGSPPRAPSISLTVLCCVLGDTDDKLPHTPSETPADLTAKHPRDVSHEFACRHSTARASTIPSFVCRRQMRSAPHHFIAHLIKESLQVPLFVSIIQNAEF